MDELDFGDLARTLDRLSAAIRIPSGGATRWVPPSDQERLVRSLREIVGLFARTDLATKRALVGASPGRAAHARAGEFKSTLEGVTRSLETYFSASFAPEDLARLRSLLEFPAPDFLAALGRAEDENSHSDVLAFLLDPRLSPGTAPVALARLAELLPDSATWNSCFTRAIERDELSVRREVQTGRFWFEDAGGLDRIDIVLSGRGFVLAIENKVWAREHDRQTETYWTWLEELPGLKGGIFLSPGGFRSHSEHFVPVSYRKMAWCFLGETPARTPEEEVMLSAYFKAVFGRVLRRNAEMILGETP